MYQEPKLKTRREHWMKPPVGVLKINCDASFQPNSMSGSWGFIIRDRNGDVVLSGSGKVTDSHAHSSATGLIEEIKDLVTSNLISSMCVERDAATTCWIYLLSEEEAEYGG